MKPGKYQMTGKADWISPLKTCHTPDLPFRPDGGASQNFPRGTEDARTSCDVLGRCLDGAGTCAVMFGRARTCYDIARTISLLGHSLFPMFDPILVLRTFVSCLSPAPGEFIVQRRSVVSVGFFFLVRAWRYEALFFFFFFF